MAAIEMKLGSSDQNSTNDDLEKQSQNSSEAGEEPQETHEEPTQDPNLVCRYQSITFNRNQLIILHRLPGPVPATPKTPKTGPSKLNGQPQSSFPASP